MRDLSLMGENHCLDAMIGPQVSAQQLQKIASYVDIGGGQFLRL